MNKPDISFKEFILLENGIILERNDDEAFRQKIYNIIKVILKHFENNKNKNLLLIPDYDIYIYIINDLSQSKGFFTRTVDGKTPVIALNVCNDNKLQKLYINNDYLAILENMAEVLFHELVHYLDYLHSKPSFQYYDNDNPYNNPQEFNGYFHQTAMKCKVLLNNTIKNKTPFEDIFGKTALDFITLFLNILKNINSEIQTAFKNNKTYNYKWKKRIYQLYFELKEIYNSKTDEKLTETIKRF